MNRQPAFTLIELLIAIAVLAVIGFAAVPGLSAILYSIRMDSGVNELAHSFHRARQNARLTGVATIVCSSADGLQCAADGKWEDGWLVFANSDADEPPVVEPGEPVLEVRGALNNMRIYANRRAFVMRPFGLRSTNGTLIWCDPRGEKHTRAIVVSYTGKPRISHSDSRGRHYRCPETD